MIADLCRRNIISVSVEMQNSNPSLHTLKQQADNGLHGLRDLRGLIALLWQFLVTGFYMPNKLRSCKSEQKTVVLKSKIVYVSKLLFLWKCG